jgi:hypothetical protein
MRKPVAFSIALILFGLANIGIAFYSASYQPTVEKVAFRWSEDDPRVKPWSWWLARKWLEQPAAPDIVLFGSSQMGSAMVASDAKLLYEAVDSLTHRRAATLEHELAARFGRKVTAFSLASPGAMCSDAFMASSTLFKNGKKPKLVVIGISPRDFIDNTMPYPGATEPFKFYSQFVNPGALTKHSYDGAFAWLQYGMENLPTRKLGTFVQASLTASGDAADAKTKANNALAAIMGGGEAVPGKWLVPAVIPPMWTDNTKEYKVRFKNPHPHVYGAEKAFFEQFLAKMESENVSVLVVGMPSLPMNRALLPNEFWSEFRNNLIATTKRHGAEWMDLSDNAKFVKSDFLDTVHLNAEGGEKLFSLIAQSIRDRSHLCSALETNRGIALKGITR